MSRTMELCEFCTQIPFDPDVLDRVDTRDPSGWRYNLGTGVRLKSSQCPFCQLVVSLFFTRRLDITTHQEIDMIWLRGMLAILGIWDTYIAFERADTGHLSTDIKHSPASFIEPSTGPLLDTTRVLRWISDCEQGHNFKCAIQTQSPFAETYGGLRLLRLIDVEAACLVEKRSLEKYVALSYVWGTVANFRLTKGNRSALLTLGSLNKIWAMLPATIKDALVLVRKLGVRYLWVDALCLLQNDAGDLEQGVNAMDLIYELAWLTIVAACGHDANAGLPGVQSGTRTASKNTVEIKAGVEMGILTGLDTMLEKSVYNSRAWTFQELVLSRRIIYFVENKVYYRCRIAEHSELTVDIFPTKSNVLNATLGSMLPVSISMRFPIHDYPVILSYYTKRALTDQRDSPRAMAGIMRRFESSMRCRFMEGLPTALFDLFILFYPNNGGQTVLHRRSSFPSYSWIGWRGCINIFDIPSIETNFNRWLEKNTWIVWYKRSASGVTNLVWDPSANESFPYKDMSYPGYRGRSSFSDGRQVSKQVDTRRITPTEEVSFSRALPIYPLLQFWTILVLFNITRIDVFKPRGYLTGLDQSECGFVYLDGFEETTFFESSGPFEFILLSEACISQEFWSPERFELRSRYSDMFVQRPSSVYNVMLLEWQDGIAERRGFGQIYKNAIDHSFAPGPIWKEIFLA